MTLLSHRDLYAGKFGLPVTARFLHADEEIECAVGEVRSQHPYLPENEANGRALARLDALKYAQMPKSIITKHHNWRKWAQIAAFLILLLAVIVLSSLRAYAQIDVITFQDSGGSNVKVFAAPFKIKCSTNLTCTAVGSTLTMVAASGGAPVGYQTLQNATVSIAQETILNWTAGITCVDNAGATRSDCALKTVAATSHLFFNAVTGGALVAAQPDYGDLTGVPSTFAPSAHNLLSASHGDTTAAAVVRGDLLTGQLASPKWQRLALGSTNLYPKSNGTDIVYSTLAASGVGTPTACTNQFVTGFTLNADAAPTSTCTTDTLASAQHANQGTTTTVLHGNGSGNPSFAAVGQNDVTNGYVDLSSTQAAISGAKAFITSATAGNFNSVLTVDGIQYTTCSAAVTAAGVVNKTIIIIPSTYAGAACPVDTSFNAPNITIWDYSGSQNPNSAPFNGCAFNHSDGNVSANIRCNFDKQTYGSTNQAIVDGYWITALDNSSPPSGGTADGIAAEVDTFNALTGTLGNAQAAELSVTVGSTGGTISNTSGGIGYVTSATGSTTAITNAAGFWARGCTSLLGSIPTNCYGVKADDQGNKGATRSYALYGVGRSLIGYSSTTSTASITFEDHSNVTHFPQLYVDSTDAFQIAALTSAGLLLQDSGLNNQVVITGTGTRFTGPTPASVSSTPGTNAEAEFTISGIPGGATTNASGTGGIGSSPAITAGNGGAASGATASTGGAGGSISLTGGNGGTGAGTGVNANGGSITVTPGTAGTGGSGTAGKAGVFSVAGSTAGAVFLTQGSTNTVANTNIPANSIIEQAPAAVTAYTITKAGAAASGVQFGVNASSTITQDSSGDSAHALTQASKTAAVTTFTLCAATAGTACGQAGQYRISYNFWGSGTACATVTVGSVGLNLTWTDENAVAHTTISVPMWDQKSAANDILFNFNTALGTEGASGSYIISTNGAIIQAATTYTACTSGTGTYNLRMAVEQLQ